MSSVRPVETPLDAILIDIQRSFQAQLYYLALTLCLAVPDICSSLETTLEDQKRWKIEKRYVQWCKDHLEQFYTKFTAEDCWALRGGVVHNGIAQTPSSIKGTPPCTPFSLNGKQFNRRLPT